MFVPIVPHPAFSSRLPLTFPFALRPAHSAHKTHRYSAEEPTQAVYTFQSTSQGPSRSLKSPPTTSSPQTKAVGQVRWPRLFVVRVNTQAHSHRRRRTQLHCLPARFTIKRRSFARPGPCISLVSDRRDGCRGRRGKLVLGLHRRYAIT